MDIREQNVASGLAMPVLSVLGCREEQVVVKDS